MDHSPLSHLLKVKLKHKISSVFSRYFSVIIACMYSNSRLQNNNSNKTKQKYLKPPNKQQKNQNSPPQQKANKTPQTMRDL